MCGIISVLSFDNRVSMDLVSALERLEYRGYDSAGIAYLDERSKLQRIRTVGKVDLLKAAVDDANIISCVGVGHTRWATHGKVTESNAHPHVADGVAVVHNGIIENYQTLRARLSADGYEFESETDTEVIAKLIASYKKTGKNFIEAFKLAIAELAGTFAIAAIDESKPNLLLGAKKGSPMAIGMSSDKRSGYIASDAVALSGLVDELVYLEEGDVVVIKKTDGLSFEIYDADGSVVSRNVVPNDVSMTDVTKNGYESFMLKEIFEEASVARKTFDHFRCDVDLSTYDGVSIIACGTSYYSGLLAKYWIENIASVHVDVEIASEFRYRNPVFRPNSLYVFVSQSGETIDTLCALRLVKEQGVRTLALVNVATSSIARESDIVVKTDAGTEIGVASTKAFISQVLSLLLMCCENVDIDSIERSINFVLNCQYDISRISRKLKDIRSLFYIGRGTSYPIALEGALKIKELSYISAEGYPAGEIKHGPIAIIDSDVYTIVLAPFDSYFEKTISNAQEILARNGRILFITTEDANTSLHGLDQNENVDILFLPKCDSLYVPFSLTTVIHLLAYYTAKEKGYDVDKPRNLAKSVTVE